MSFSDPKGLSSDFVVFTKVDNSNIPKVFLEFDEVSNTYAAMLSFMVVLGSYLLT